MKLLGIKESKMTKGKNEGKTAYTYYLGVPFSEYEINSSVCQGMKVSSEFSYTRFGVAVGDEVQAVYEKGFEDKAVLTNLIPFKASNK